MSSVLQAFLLAILAAALLTRDMALVVGTALLAFLAYGISALSDYEHVRRNWGTYRCNPQYTAFAKYYGHDLQETLNACIQEEVRRNSGEVMRPVYEGVAKVVGVVDGVYDRAEAVAGGVENLLGGFKNFVVNFASSFRLVGTRARMSLIRVKDIFARIYGIFIAFSYAAISALTFGENLVCNPLVTFVAGIAGADVCCFAPGTRVRLATGGAAAIEDVRIGDELSAGAGRVSSVYRFSGRGIPMVWIEGVRVSTNHALRAPDASGWIPAGEHPLATPAEECELLYCLGTEGNQIPVVCPDGAVDAVYTDYEESSAPEIIAAAQAAAETAVNPDGFVGPTVPDYGLGLAGDCRVRMAAGRQLPLRDVRVGHILANGQRVIGVIHEICPTQVRTPGGSVVAAAQLVWWGGRWRRACWLDWPAVAAEAATEPLVHLMVDSIGSFIVEDASGVRLIVRDYAEAADAQGPYDAALGVRKLDPPARPPTPYPDDDDALLD
jgi:hypothetical protein